MELYHGTDLLSSLNWFSLVGVGHIVRKSSRVLLVVSYNSFFYRI